MENLTENNENESQPSVAAPLTVIGLDGYGMDGELLGEVKTEDAKPEEKPAAETTTDEKPAEETPAQTEAITSEAYNALKAEVEQLKNAGPAKEYVVPEALMEYINTNDVADRIAAIKSTSPIEAYRAHVKETCPWAQTPEDVDFEIKTRYPDYDPEIPENAGMPDSAYKKFVYDTDGIKAKGVEALKKEYADKIEEFKSNVQPTTAQPKAPPTEAERQAEIAQIQKEVEAQVDADISAFDLSTLPQFDGVELPPLDKAELRERALRGDTPWTFDKAGNDIKDVRTAARLMQLENAAKAMQPMVAAFKRLDPKLTKEAMQQSLNNVAPPLSATGAQLDKGASPKEKQRYGFEVVAMT